MENDYYIGSIFADDKLVKTSIFKLEGNIFTAIDNKNINFKLGEKKLDYNVTRGVIHYTKLELKDIVSLNFFRTMDNKNKIIEEYQKNIKLKKLTLDF